MFGEKEESQSQYKKKREEFSVNIRKNNREQKFNKRRCITSGPLTVDELNEDNKDKIERQIIDPNLFDKILEFVNTEFEEQQLPHLLKLLMSSDILQKHYAIIGIRKLLAVEVDPPIQAVIDFGTIPIFLEFANQTQYPQLKLEAVWCMTNVASGTNDHCRSLVDKGGLQIFITALEQNVPGIVDQAIWAVGNLAADRVSYRDRLLSQNTLLKLIRVIEQSNNKLLIKNGTWALTNLCRGLPSPNYNTIKPAVPILCKVLKSGLITDKQILSDLCWALSYMTQGSKARVQRVLEEGILEQLFKLASSPYQLLCVPALRIIGNFSTGNELQTEELIKNNIFSFSVTVLGNVKTAMRRQMCWILSNIVVGPQSHAHAFLRHQQLISKLIQLFEKDLLTVKKQICWIFANLAHSRDRKEVILLIHQQEIIKYFVNMLNEQEEDALMTVLETLEKLFHYGDKEKINGLNILLKSFQNLGGTQKLEQLQFQESKQVYDYCIRIIQQFFNVEQDTFQF